MASFLEGAVFTAPQSRDAAYIVINTHGDHSTDAELPPSVGERNSAAVLTEDKVRAIRQAADAGADLATLARAFHVHVRTARHIVQRTSWRHVV